MRTRISTIALQDNFLNQLAAGNRGSVPLVVALSTPGPVLTNFRSNSEAVLNMFLAGEEAGNAYVTPAQRALISHHNSH